MADLDPSTWLVENAGVAIGTAGIDKPGKIRVVAEAEHGELLAIPAAIDLFSRALAQLGGVRQFQSATEEAALRLAEHASRERLITQDKLENALQRLGQLEAENTQLRKALAQGS